MHYFIFDMFMSVIIIISRAIFVIYLVLPLENNLKVKSKSDLEVKGFLFRQTNNIFKINYKCLPESRCKLYV